MRVYLVIMDETAEARVALRFASRRAAKTDGMVHILALVPPQEFVAFGGVQATAVAVVTPFGTFPAGTPFSSVWIEVDAAAERLGLDVLDVIARRTTVARIVKL